MFHKLAQTVNKSVKIKKVTLFKVSQKVTKYLAFFSKNIFCQTPIVCNKIFPEFNLLLLD